MKLNFRHITSALLMPVLFAVLGSLASCTAREDDPIPVPVPVGDELQAMFTISMGDVTGSRAGTPTDGPYEGGEGLENMIDIEGSDYRCYLFSTDNMLVSTLSVTKVYKIDTETTGRNYSVFATLRPFEIDAIKKGCKVVILANWKEYVNAEAGRTTIESLCSAQEAVFEYNAEKASLSDDNLIPMYGVKTFEGEMGMNEAKDTYQVGTVRMLRAYAKVEVNVEFKDFTEDPETNGVAKPSVNAVTLTNCYNKGYKVQDYSHAQKETDYVHGSWASDYTPVHIPDNAETLHELELPEASTLESPNRFVVYLPEYNNLLDGNARVADERARIKIAFEVEDHAGRNNYTGYVDFCKTEGAVSTQVDEAPGADDKTFIDIERNNWYKFNVTISPKAMEYVLDVQPYALAELAPGFGLERDQYGNIIVRDPNNPSHIIKVIKVDGEIITGSPFFQIGDVAASNLTDSKGYLVARLFEDGRKQLFYEGGSWDILLPDESISESFELNADATPWSLGPGTWSHFDPYGLLIERYNNVNQTDDMQTLIGDDGKPLTDENGNPKQDYLRLNIDKKSGSQDVRYRIKDYEHENGKIDSRDKIDTGLEADIWGTKYIDYYENGQWVYRNQVQVIKLKDGTIANTIIADASSTYKQKEASDITLTSTSVINIWALEVSVNGILRYRYFESGNYQNLYSDGTYNDNGEYNADGSYDLFLADGTREASYVHSDRNYDGKSCWIEYDEWNHIVTRYVDVERKPQVLYADGRIPEKQVVRHTRLAEKPTSSNVAYITIEYKESDKWVKMYEINKDGQILSKKN